MFFLAGGFVQDPIVRTATVAENQTLFFPLINAISAFRPGDPDFPAGGDPAILQDARDFFGTTSGLFLNLDGSPVVLPPGPANLSAFYQQVLFDLTVPTDNVFGAPPGLYRAASVGIWAALTLPPGNFQLSFGGTSTGVGIYAGNDPFNQNITYNLTVTAVPAPAAAVLFAMGMIGVGVAGRWRRKAVPAM